MSRRDMLARLFKPVRAAAAAFPTAQPAPRPPGAIPARDPLARPAGPTASVPFESAPPANAPVANLDRLAVIAGRDCLAYQGTTCTVCHDRCPVAGAILLEQGLPRVEPAVCIGCGVCHDVCPAPDNAVRVVPRPPGLPRPGGANTTSPAPANPPPAHSPFPSLEPRPEVEDV